MKKIALTAVAALMAYTPAFAGNAEVFVVEDDEIEQPAGSNAAWVVPVLALVIIGAAIALSDDDDEPAADPEPDVSESDL